MSTRIGFLMRIPPPLLFVVTFFGAVGIQRLVPLPAIAPSLAAAGRIAGFGLVAIGFVLMLSSVIIFLVTRTTIIPFGTAKHLVVRGPYGVTRNPMYLGLVLLYVGVAVILQEFWALAMLPLPVLIMQRVVIPYEEARMREVFGDVFAQYSAKVPRWI